MNRISHFALVLLAAAFMVVAALFVVFTIVLAESPAAHDPPATGDAAAYDIPSVENIIIDGDGDDWGDRGFRVDHIAAPDGTVRPAEDFDVRLRLGWNDEGLLAFVTVRDDVPWEAPERVWHFDCVEFFVAEGAGSGNFYQVIVNSGADPEFGGIRQRIFDKRPEDRREPAELTIKAASRIIEGGYRIEALFPWRNLGIEPRTGAELAFQLVANDDDGAADPPDGAIRQGWYPSTRSHEDPGLLHPIRLAETPGDPVRFRVDRNIERSSASIIVRGVEELVGETVVVRNNGREIAEFELASENGRAGAALRVPCSELNVVPAMEVIVAGEHAVSFEECPTVGYLLDRCVAAMGGTDAIKKLETRACTATLTHDYPHGNPPLWSAPAEAYGTVPGMYAVLLRYDSGDLWFGCDGEFGWMRDADGFRRYDAAKRTPLEPFLNPQGILDLYNYFGGLVLEERTMHGGRPVYFVRPKDPERDVELYFDVESGFLTNVGAWSFADYREVDGVMFPFRMTAARRGGESYYEFHEVRHDEPLDDVQFSMPDEAIVIRDPFAGIDDARVLPMLKHLPYRHGGMNIPPRDGRLLYNLIKENGYKRGLEIGTSNGYSTLWLGLAFRKTGGEVITIEIEEPSGREALENFERAGLDDVIDARIADAFQEIPEIEGMFDFVFIDAWKPDYIKFLRLVRDRVVLGGAITAHNVSSHEDDTEAFIEALRSDPGLETTIYRISEAGVSVSIVRQ